MCAKEKFKSEKWLQLGGGKKKRMREADKKRTFSGRGERGCQNFPLSFSKGLTQVPFLGEKRRSLGNRTEETRLV